MVYNFKTIRKGFYKPINPKKYVGDVNDIVYRSNLERRFMKFFDMNPNVIEWASEIFHVEYVSPVDNRVHRYFPDFVIKVRDKAGKVTVYVIEIKPEKFTMPPVTKNRSKKSVLNETVNYVINEAKWNAVKKWCEKNKCKFLIMTEKDLATV